MEKRLHPNRPGQSGTPMEIAAPVAPVRGAPSETAAQATQALLGERILAFENQNGFVWCQLLRDKYVGFVRADLVSEKLSNPTHRIGARSTYLYPSADIKSQPAVSAPMNAMLEIVATGSEFSALANGKYVFAKHIKSSEEREKDFVRVAEQFLHAPYYWGGKSHLGLDCSGLVQISLEACGVPALRDTDLQEQQLGQALSIDGLAGLRRGDLVFWRGHVGIMCDDKNLLHANGFHMMTVKEPLAEAVARIAAAGSQITSIKRLQ
jgi:cell wall-associated NlpC family hydrolase